MQATMKVDARPHWRDVHSAAAEKRSLTRRPFLLDSGSDTSVLAKAPSINDDPQQILLTISIDKTIMYRRCCEVDRLSARAELETFNRDEIGGGDGSHVSMNLIP
jgi:hypothetical protein